MFFEKNVYPETSIPKKVDKKITIANIANHINHCDATLTKEPLSIPFQGINVYVARVTKIKNKSKFVKVIYRWFNSITSLTSAPLYFDKGLINLLEAIRPLSKYRGAEVREVMLLNQR